LVGRSYFLRGCRVLVVLGKINTKKDNMNVCSPRGLGQANTRKNTGVRREDMKRLHHKAKFIDQGCIKTTEECRIFQILR
jgi:hypothetical protein